MIIRKKPMNRRSFLRGLGVGIGLPFLDIMRPSESYAEEANGVSRTAFVYIPNGWYRRADHFFPEAEGADYTAPQILQPLESLKDRFTIISNLNNEGGRANGDGAGDHARAGGSYLSSVKLLKSATSINGGKSIDRHIAEQTGIATPIDMLLMGYGNNDTSDSGYNSLNGRLSWRSPTEPVHWENNLQNVFDRLVSNNIDAGSQTTEADRRREMRKSVLDYVIYDDLPRLQNKLGQVDKEKLDSYLTGLRDVERRLDALIPGSGSSCEIVDLEGAGGTMSEQISLMFDLMIKAFQCDLTRVSVIGFSRELTGAKPNGLALSNGWHATSHYSGDDIKIADYLNIGNWLSERAAELINKLDDAGLTQSSLISYGAGSGGNYSQGHGDDNLPTLLIGEANGAVRTGRHLKLASSTPIANLWSAMAYHAGVAVPNDTWGTYGTGRLDLS